jgi:nucleotide-binding universal stress UspA family protein
MYACIVVGTDGSPTADKAVEVAANQARQFRASLHLVTAYQSTAHGMASLSGAELVDPAAEKVWRERIRQIGERAVATWGEGVVTERHVVSGPAANAILNTAADVGADLIVVGSQGMQGLRRVLGSVPNSVAHGASCDVLIVKTD